MSGDNINTQPSPLGPNPFLRAALSMGGLLALFALVTLFLCILTHQLTLSRIEANRRQALEKALVEVMPRHYFENDLLNHTLSISSPLLNYDYPVTAYVPKKDQVAQGIIFPVAAPEGYGGTIHLLIGVDSQGIITGVRVLPPHPETPGLGDKIDRKKSDWIEGFTGKSLKNTPEQQWAVKKDGGSFDSFTGATITPRAVIKGVHNALQFYQLNQKKLLNAPTPKTPTFH